MMMSVSHGVSNCVHVATAMVKQFTIYINPPHSFQVSISDVAPLGSYIAEPQANDGDGGPDGDISYSIISGNEDGFFQIAPTFGTVTVQHSPLLAKDYTLTITATDHGNPHRSSLQNAVVVVMVIASTPVACSDPRYGK